MIISYAHPKFVLQVADRRVTTFSGGTRSANKIVVLYNRMAFSYTGLAVIGGVNTDDWLSHRLQEVADEPLQAQIEHIRQSATEAIALENLILRTKILAIIGVGWHHMPEFGAQPILIRVSNCYTPDGQRLTGPLGEFAIQSWSQPSACHWLATGTYPRPEIATGLGVKLAKCASHRYVVRNSLKLIEHAIRDTSHWCKGIGDELLAVFLPRSTGLNPTVAMLNPVTGIAAVGGSLENPGAGIQLMGSGSHPEFYCLHGKGRREGHSPIIVSGGGNGISDLVATGWCPVCAHTGFIYPMKTHDKCPCCHWEFGVSNHETTVEAHRQSWIAGGAEYFWGGPGVEPSGFDAVEQLRRIHYEPNTQEKFLIAAVNGGTRVPRPQSM